MRPLVASLRAGGRPCGPAGRLVWSIFSKGRKICALAIGWARGGTHTARLVSIQAERARACGPCGDGAGGHAAILRRHYG
jgi:hypothetical protein